MGKTLFDELKSFSQIGFREIYRKFIYIHCRELMDIIFPDELDDSITGLITPSEGFIRIETEDVTVQFR